ncbi:DUF1127 domain-containing protein [Natronohydrobacter thiooxidans]|jgi:uncharacterized protein YjiS (DUF1127 family)|uniref:DUF1127 domain-containing protein n=1 Tax=Natronohydrobacter thiooxidans TaxID=87172 RepID=UPI0008FF6307|nr:DUF1127 domain-containing protein [Natronohydrobacter thiooxidans]
MLRAIHLPVRSVFHGLRRFAPTRILALRRTRARLAQLEDHLLKDIGLTREEAAREAARSSWDAPRHWLQ